MQLNGELSMKILLTMNGELSIYLAAWITTLLFHCINNHRHIVNISLFLFEVKKLAPQLQVVQCKHCTDV